MTAGPLTRRAILGATAKVGAAGILGAGAARTTGALVDREVLRDARLTGGRLDLSVAHTAVRNGALVSQVPSPDGPRAGYERYVQSDGVAVVLDGLRPGDRGVVVTGFAVCDNPANVWLRLVARDDENGTTDLESVVDETVGGDLSEALHVRVWYDEDCDGVYDPRTEQRIAEGPLATVVDGVLGDAYLLDGDVRNPLSDECRPLGKLETTGDNSAFELERDDGNDAVVGPNQFWLRADDGSDAEALVEIVDVVLDEDGEIQRFGYVVRDGNVGICRADVKHGGGRDAVTPYVYADCTDRGTNLRSSNGTAVSHVEFSYCTPPEPRECFRPCPETSCLGLEWWLPEETGQQIETDRLELRIELYAEQCRNVETPTAPWGTDR